MSLPVTPIPMETFFKLERSVKTCTPFDRDYQSGTAPVSLLSRMFPSLILYSRFLRIVFQSSAKAKRGRYDDDAFCQSSLAVMRALEAVGVGFDISGLEHLQRLEGPCVVVANHMSVMEAMVLPTIIMPFRKTTFIIKEGLMRYPVFKHVMASRDPIVVSRANPRQDLKTVLQQGAMLLKKGVSVVVFPQTTRAQSFDPELFNSLGMKLAARAKVPALPLALLTDAWGNGRLVKEFGKIDPRKRARFAFGAPIEVRGRGAGEHQRVIEFISHKLDHWQGLR